MNPLKMLLRVILFWKKPRSVVPVVRLSGMIASSSQTRRGLSLEGVEPQLKKAFAIRGAKAVALIINSPGGSPVHRGHVYDILSPLAARKSAARSEMPSHSTCTCAHSRANRGPSERVRSTQ